MIYKQLNSILRFIATEAAMGVAYPSWSDEYAREKVREAWTHLPGQQRKPFSSHFTIEQLRSLSEDELNSLGFNLWEAGHRLIPLWAWHYIADGEALLCIDGETKVKGKDEIDLDQRYGCVAYGFRV